VRRLVPLLAAALVVACHQRVRRTAGDEVPYPAIDEASLDRNTGPCQDFYQFACGGWAAEVPVPADRTQWIRGAGEVEERNARLLRRILEDAGAGKVGSQERFGRKAGDFYAACMDDADVEASGLAELQAEWARIDAVSDRQELGEELSRLESMGLRAPFGIRAEPDPAAAARDLLVIGRQGVGLAPGDRSGGAQPSDDAGPGAPDAIAGGRAAHVQAMLRLGGLPAERVETEGAAAASLEHALEGASPAGPARPPERLDRAALQRLAPGFPWSRFLRALGAERLEVVGVDDPAFAARVAEAFQQAPISEWKAYLLSRLEEAMAAERALPTPAVQEWFRFQGTLGPTPRELRPRWKHCVDVTARTLPFSAGAAFARKHLKASGRERAGSLVSYVQKGMLAAVEAAPWIDGPTQSRAAAKLDRMVAQIGYPESGPDYYTLRVGRESYFRNLLSAGRFEVSQQVARASRPVDRGEWLVGPYAAAPEYWPARNALCIPAGALQPPLYNTEANDPVVYGSMGTAIGRCMAEALQGEGRERGPEGAALDWWTPATARAFEPRATCLADQFGAYEPAPGKRLDGRRTLVSNLADLAGLRAAWEAMRAARIANPASDKRVLGFTADQQFFIGFAQSLCASAAESPADQGVPGAVPPARFRVNGPLSNMPEFAGAFRCGAGSPMVRPAAARCDIW
jgi:putative endopeptidase